MARKAGVKKDGTLRKGYRYAKGGRVVKAKATSSRKKRSGGKKKRILGIF